MENHSDFDALSRKATQTNVIEDLNELFGAAFALNEWNFIMRGDLPNVYPYIASNEKIANNQPMIRAFTDTNRLMRFARENNLIETDGSAKILTIPTANIIPYLEGLVSNGAYGVWFNSDTDSDGFYIPIKQLQPIKEHLTKLNPPQQTNFQKQGIKTGILIINDGLGFPSGFVSNASYTINIFFRVPENWTSGAKLNEDAQEKIFQFLYGENWRRGNDDGSFYVVRDSYSSVFDEETVKNTTWEGTTDTDENHYRFYLVNGAGTIKSVKEKEFQADIKTELNSVLTPEIPNKTESFQTTESPDVNSDLKITVNKKEPVEILQLIVTEGLMLPSGEIKTAPYTTNVFWLMPADWLEKGKIKTERLGTIEQRLSGGDSEMIPGAFYVAVDYSIKIFRSDELKTAAWSEMIKSDESNTFFIGSENGSVKKVSAEEFQVDVDAFFQSPTREITDGKLDSIVTVNKIGTVNFNISILPFYQAIVPLLNEYQGAGDYATLLRFEPGGISELVENVIENPHGAYLRIRRFSYLNPKNGVQIGVNSIHSNRLRHVQSNAELFISLELCRNLDNQTAAFYHAFQGPKNEVVKLSDAIQPILDSVGYKEVQ